MLKTTFQIRAKWNNMSSKVVHAAAAAAAKWFFFSGFLSLNFLPFLFSWRSAAVPAVPGVHPQPHLSTSLSSRPPSHGRTHININDTPWPLMRNITAWRTAVPDKPLGIKGQGELENVYLLWNKTLQRKSSAQLLVAVIWSFFPRTRTTQCDPCCLKW